MNLCPLAVVLPLAGKLEAIESLQHLLDSLRRVSQHGFKRCTGEHRAALQHLTDTVLQQDGNDLIVIGTLTVHRLQRKGNLVHSSLHLRLGLLSKSIYNGGIPTSQLRRCEGTCLGQCLQQRLLG
uniref:Putative secreted protein n=1 Tax=Anopheles marajoara TaxID=58244 RepID=A0A2M4C7A7_9DIPT